MSSRGVNKVILVGRLGNDPEVRAMPSGGTVANVSLATSESWRDKNTGEQQERTEWHRIVFYGRQAEVVRDYLRKGSQVFIEGSLRTNKWQDKSGQDRYTTEIIANNMQMLDRKGDNSDGGSGSGSGFGGSAPSGSAGGSAGGSAAGSEMQGSDFGQVKLTEDDDIPF